MKPLLVFLFCALLIPRVGHTQTLKGGPYLMASAAVGSGQTYGGAELGQWLLLSGDAPDEIGPAIRLGLAVGEADGWRVALHPEVGLTWAKPHVLFGPSLTVDGKLRFGTRLTAGVHLSELFALGAHLTWAYGTPALFGGQLIYTFAL